MIVNLFEIPIFIGNIDVEKIKLLNKNITKEWMSETPTTFQSSWNNIQEKDVTFLLNHIVKIMEEKIKHPFELRLLNIWENHYKNGDFQEPHIHANSDFSFIIYKKVTEGRTAFLNPIRKYLMLYQNINHMYEQIFEPKCKTGQIVIFPSFLEHMVLKSTNQITISGNLSFKKVVNNE